MFCGADPCLEALLCCVLDTLHIAVIVRRLDNETGVLVLLSPEAPEMSRGCMHVADTCVKREIQISSRQLQSVRPEHSFKFMIAMAKYHSFAVLLIATWAIAPAYAARTLLEAVRPSSQEGNF